MDFGYLHLIDNLTDNDVDLLETPSYSFEAKHTDYASRHVSTANLASGVYVLRLINGNNVKTQKIVIE